MSKVLMNNEVFEKDRIEKKEREKQISRERRKNIVIGATLRAIHKKQGTEIYLLQVIEPYLSKENRKLFGLPF